MNSRLAEALRLKTSPVAVILTDDKPAEALQFKEQRWGCVGSMLATAAEGRTAVFDRQTFGCPGGGTALGFGDQYQKCRFAIDYLLANGNEEIAAKMGTRTRMWTGEHFFKSEEVARRWLSSLPITEIPTEYVVFKPLEQLAEGETAEQVVFFVGADQLSALVVMADYERGSGDAVVALWGGACQSILQGYAEARREQPRGVIGFFDVAQRSRVGSETLTFTAPWTLFEEMEANVEGSFLGLDDWRELAERQ